MLGRVARGVFLDQIGIQEKKNACALAIERISSDAIEFVNRPDDEVAFRRSIAAEAEQRPNAIDGFPFTSREIDNWPRRAPFAIFSFAIDDLCEADWKSVSGGVARRRPQLRVNGKINALRFDIRCPNAEIVFKIKRPQRKKFVVAANNLDVAETVG